MVNLGDYEIISNQEAGYGRVDIIVLHKKDKNRLAIVMELKTIDDFTEETKEKALLSAVKQIREKEYISLVQKIELNLPIKYYLLFSKSGFTKDLLEIEKNRNDVVLIDSFL